MIEGREKQVRPFYLTEMYCTLYNTDVKNKIYPEWVNKYRGKGRTIKKVGNKYYLYKTSSKRIKGKDYPVTSSTYIGIITEDKGLLRTNNKVLNCKQMNENKELLSPKNKIKIFISSNIDHSDKEPKYNQLRKKLYNLLEDSGYFTVYAFEETNASTDNTYNHYLSAIDDSDVVIFLIDSKDGPGEGTQEEINFVREHNKKGLYYFCDEYSKTPTKLEEDLRGKVGSKYKVVNKFDDLLLYSAKGIMEDIFRVYHDYCNGRYISSGDGADIKNINNESEEDIAANTEINKNYFKNIDKSTRYLLKRIIGTSNTSPLDDENTSELDQHTLSFLKVFLKEETMGTFNVESFVRYLKEIQSKELNDVVVIRWKAIKEYYNGNLENTYNLLDQALNEAKKLNIPKWYIQELLIDKRNINLEKNNEIGRILVSCPEQDELINIESAYHIPILDRYNSNIESKLNKELFETEVASPYTITFGNNISDLAKEIVTTLIIAMYYGSITNINAINSKIRDFVFYISNKYKDVDMGRPLIMYSIICEKYKDIDKILRRYPYILADMSNETSNELMSLYKYEPIKYKKIITFFNSFKIAGYYLKDDEFQEYESRAYEYIEEWMKANERPIQIAETFFKCMNKVCYRLDQNRVADICISFLKKQYSRYYKEMFDLIVHCIDLNKIEQEKSNELIKRVYELMERDTNKQHKYDIEYFLVQIKKSNNILAASLDEIVKKYDSNLFDDFYQINTNDNPDYEIEFVKENLKKIENINHSQGRGGVYTGYGTNYLKSIWYLLKDGKLKLDKNEIDTLIRVCSETVAKSKQDIAKKIDAVQLLSLLDNYYPESIANNKYVNEILNNNYDSYIDSNSIYSTNIEKIGLFIAIEILKMHLNGESLGVAELLAYLNGYNEATKLSAIRFIANDMETCDVRNKYKSCKEVLYTETLEWLDIDNTLDIKWEATRVIMNLMQFSNLRKVLQQKLIFLVKNDSPYIKNKILQSIKDNKYIDNKTKKEIIELGVIDTNYVTRYIAKEIKRS